MGSFAFSRSDFAARYRPYVPHNRTSYKGYQRERRYEIKIEEAGERDTETWNEVLKRERGTELIGQKFNKEAMYVHRNIEARS